MKKILFCDLDGTLRRPLSGGNFAKHPRDYQIIPGVETHLNAYYSEDWKIYGISNQGGVAAGKKSLEDCVSEMYYAMDIIPHLTSILFCPDFEGKRCLAVTRMNLWHIKELQNISNENPDLIGTYRKPNPGMLQIILQRTKALPNECRYIGDREEDKAAAHNAGVPFTWAIDWRGDNG